MTSRRRIAQAAAATPKPEPGAKSRRRTKARVAIAVELLTSAGSVHWGYELSRTAGVGAGSMYPFLAELLEAGYLTDGWETAPTPGRPPRRYYEVTDEGRGYLQSFLSAGPATVAKSKNTKGATRRPAVEL